MQVGYIQHIGLAYASTHREAKAHCTMVFFSSAYLLLPGLLRPGICRDYAGMFGEMLPRYTRGLCIDFSGDVQANVAPPYRDLLWM